MPGIWGATMNDTHSYLDPIDNLLRNGNYSPDYRMPGYGSVYLLFRLAFSQAVACNLLILLQFILAGISVYYLALIAKCIFKNDRIFYVCFYLFLVSTYSNYYDGWLLTESFCSSALIFSTWHFVKYFSSGHAKNLFFSGLLLTWAIFLRPVFLPLVFVFPILLLLNRKQLVLKSILVFLIPFVLVEEAWVVRNYLTHQKIILLTSASLAPRAANFYENSLNDFIRSWGGSADYTDNNSPLLWFGFHLKGMPNPADYHGSLPASIYTSRFNADSLIKLKNKIIALNDSSLSPEERNNYQYEVKGKIDLYTLSVKNEKPFLYYIEAPFIKCLPRFLFGPESKIYMKRFQLPGIPGSLTEFIFTLFYYVVLAFGIIGMSILLYTGVRSNPPALIIAIIPLYTILAHAIVLRVTSNRFLIPAWAFLVICAAYGIIKIFSGKKYSTFF